MSRLVCVIDRVHTSARERLALYSTAMRCRRLVSDVLCLCVVILKCVGTVAEIQNHVALPDGRSLVQTM